MDNGELSVKMGLVWRKELWFVGNSAGKLLLDTEELGILGMFHTCIIVSGINERERERERERGSYHISLIRC